MKDFPSRQKIRKLEKYIKQKGSQGVIVAFSGGVDSATLAALSHRILGGLAAAATAQSPTYSREENKEAKKLAEKIRIKHFVVRLNQCGDKNFAKNPENRCYYCKKQLLAALQRLARKKGFHAIFEGTNYDDLRGHRPGFKAIQETQNAYSPWAENKFSKREIRALAKKLGLDVADKPSQACLASRVPFSQKITAKRLARIEKAERAVRKITGARQLRVRDYGDVARIEVAPDERKIFFDARVMDEVAKALARIGYKFAALDLQGYRAGSMLAAIKKGQ